MSDDEPSGIEGEDPMAEVGPHGCEVGPTDCGVLADDVSACVDQTSWPIAAELDEPFPVEELKTVLGPDGLPDHSLDDPNEGEAPPFTYETVCCIADDRTFVEIFMGEAHERYPSFFAWDAVTRKPLALDMRSRYDDEGVEMTRRTFPKKDVIVRWGIAFVKSEEERLVFVRPLREQCIHYKRQLWPIEGQTSMKAVFRNCIHPARRSIGGAALSLRDEAIYGCDYREPYDAAVNAAMDAADQHKLDTQPHRTRLPMWGTTGDKIVPESP